MRAVPCRPWRASSAANSSEFREAVFAWVHGECAERPGVEHAAWNFLEQQQPTGAQHSGDLGDGQLPVRVVVDDAEVNDGVVVGGRLMDVADIAD